MKSTYPEAEAVAEWSGKATQKHPPPELEARTEIRPRGEAFGAGVVDTDADNDRVLVSHDFSVDDFSGDDDLLDLRAKQLAQVALEERVREKK